MAIQDIVVILFICFGAAAAIYTRRLTVAAGITGAVLALMIYAAAGITGLALMAAFFVLGTAATSWRASEKIDKKERSDSLDMRRNTGQVLANAGVAGLAATFILLFPAYKELFLVALAAVFSSATADTLSSELGTVYGRRFYNILSFKKDAKGRDGVVSVQGTLFGVAGSCVIAAIYSIGFSWSGVGWIIIAGTVGNLTDSILGATVERKGMVNNDVVNFLNTFIAAIVAVLLYLAFG